MSGLFLRAVSLPLLLFFMNFALSTTVFVAANGEATQGCFSSTETRCSVDAGIELACGLINSSDVTISFSEGLYTLGETVTCPIDCSSTLKLLGEASSGIVVHVPGPSAIPLFEITALSEFAATALSFVALQRPLLLAAATSNLSTTHIKELSLSDVQFSAQETTAFVGRFEFGSPGILISEVTILNSLAPLLDVEIPPPPPEEESFLSGKRDEITLVKIQIQNLEITNPSAAVFRLSTTLQDVQFDLSDSHFSGGASPLIGSNSDADDKTPLFQVEGLHVVATLTAVVTTGRWSQGPFRIRGGYGLEEQTDGYVSVVVRTCTFGDVFGLDKTSGHVVDVVCMACANAEGSAASVQVQNSHFRGLEFVGESTCPRTSGGGFVHAYFVDTAGGDVEFISDRNTYENASNGCSGGAIGLVFDGPGIMQATVTLTNDVFRAASVVSSSMISNDVPMMSGGFLGLYVAARGVLVDVENVTFREARTDGRGGAVSLWLADVPLINSWIVRFQHCHFFRNLAALEGGALSVTSLGHHSVDLALKSTSFFNNRAMHGGALYLGSPSGTPIIEIDSESAVEQNQASSCGGGIVLDCLDVSHVYLEAPTTGNQAIVGGGIYFALASLAITQLSTVTKNFAVNGENFSSMPVYLHLEEYVMVCVRQDKAKFVSCRLPPNSQFEDAYSQGLSAPTFSPFEIQTIVSGSPKSSWHTRTSDVFLDFPESVTQGDSVNIVFLKEIFTVWIGEFKIMSSAWVGIGIGLCTTAIILFFMGVAACCYCIFFSANQAVVNKKRRAAKTGKLDEKTPILGKGSYDHREGDSVTDEGSDEDYFDTGDDEEEDDEYSGL